MQCRTRAASGECMRAMWPLLPTTPRLAAAAATGLFLPGACLRHCAPHLTRAMGAEQSVPAEGGGAGKQPSGSVAKPSALVIVGPSGVGKGTLIERCAGGRGALAAWKSHASGGSVLPGRSAPPPPHPPPAVPNPLQAHGGQALRFLLFPHHAAATPGRSGESSLQALQQRWQWPGRGGLAIGRRADGWRWQWRGSVRAARSLARSPADAARSPLPPPSHRTARTTTSPATRRWRRTSRPASSWSTRTCT